MNCLALDSSQEILSAALSSGGRVFYAEIDSGQRHSELIMECADWLCKTAAIKPGDIDSVACMKGPGSFTGLRIAYSSAKGIALALGIPLAAVPTLDCIAFPLSFWPGIVLPSIDAKQGRFFSALYRGGKRLSGYLDASPETIALETEKAKIPGEQAILTGPGAELLKDRLDKHYAGGNFLLDPQFRLGRAKELLHLAKSIIIEGNDDLNSGPVYLRKSDAELSRDK